jgi:hypothetical protein
MPGVGFEPTDLETDPLDLTRASWRFGHLFYTFYIPLVTGMPGVGFEPTSAYAHQILRLTP